MPKMGDRLDDDEQRRFVGRSDVLRTIDDFLNGRHAMVLSVVGIGGIGKSSVLRQAVIRARADGWTTIRTDVNLTATALDWLENAAGAWSAAIGPPVRYAHAKEELHRVTDSMRAALSEEEHRTGSPLSRDAQSELVHAVLSTADAELYLNGRRELSRCLADDLGDLRSRRVLITVDTFEKATQAFEDWLRTELLPELDDTVRLLIGGQRRLEVGWEVWRPFIQTVELSNFTESELRELIEAGAPGIRLDEKQLMKSTGGYPLAASLIVTTSYQADDGDFADFRDQSIGRIFRSIPDPDLRELVEVAAGFPLVTLDVLAAATGERVPSALWRALRDLPFVSRGDRGLQVHDVVQRYLITSALEHSPTEFARRHMAAASYWRSNGNIGLYVHHLCVAQPAQAVRVIRSLTRAAHARGDSSQADAIVSQLETSAPLFAAHATVARLTDAYIATLDGDWDIAAQSLDACDPLGPSTTPNMLELKLEVDLFRCEISRYLGDLVSATRTAEAGIETLRLTTQPADSESIGLVTAELRAQLVELYGLRGLMAQAERAAAELARSEVQGKLTDEFVGRLQLFHREHLARWQGVWHEALISLEHVADLDISSDRYGQSRLLYGVGRVFTYIGWFTAARELLLSAEQGFREAHRSQQLGEALVGLSIVARENSAFEESASLLAEAMGLFAAGGSSLYGCWVKANQYRTLAVSTPSAIELDALDEFSDRCAKMEYRHGEGHSLYARDVVTGSSPGAAADAFASWGMRYEALEARVSYRIASMQPAADLAIKAASAGDLWTTARAMRAEPDWLEFEQFAGPQCGAFSAAGVTGFLPGVDLETAVSLSELSSRIYGKLRSRFG